MKKVMIKRFLLFVVGVLLFGCSTMPKYVRENPGSYYKVARIGVSSKEDDNNNVIIGDIAKDSPAEKYGLSKGDIIESMDDNLIKTDKDIRKYMNTKTAEDIITIRIKRDNEIKQIELKPKELWIQKVIYKIGNMLDDGKKVSLAVIVLEPQNPQAGVLSSALGVNTDNAMNEWKRNIKNSLYQRHESGLLNMFGNNSAFYLVDRQRIDDILKELKYNASGIMSTEIQNKLGKILGLTHLLYIDFCRYIEGDVTNLRVIEIETGKVLENINLKSKY